MTAIPEPDVIRALARLVHEKGPSLRTAARAMGYSYGYLSGMLNQRYPIPKPLLDQLGFRCRKEVIRVYEVME